MKKNLIALERDIPYDWDDYGVWCSFYYDPNEKKIIRSDYGHGTDDAYSGVSYEIAIANGMVTRDEIIDALIERFNKYVTSVFNYASNFSGKRINMPCSVERGRKFRGEGIATCVFVEHSMYHSDKTLVEVIDPTTNIAYNISSSYVKLHSDGILDYFKKWVSENNKLGSVIHQLAYDASYSHCDRVSFDDNWVLFVRDVVTKYMGREISGEYTNVDNEKKAQKLKEKNDKLYAENIDRVRAWAREKFAGRSESDIEEIIDKTMKKYYTKK